MFRMTLIALLLSACGGSSSTTTATKTGTDTTTPKAAAEVVEVGLAPDRITVDEAKGTVTLKPNSRVQRPSYTTWVFDLASYNKHVPANLDKGIRVRAEIISSNTRVHKPAEGMPAPDGGFQFITKKARVVGLVK